MSIQTQAMLVTLSVSCWTGRVQDKKVSAEVEVAHGATDAGRYNKLLVDKAHMDPLVQFAGKVRQYHYKMSLPWLDNGARLLPSALFLEYSHQIRQFTSEYERIVDAFIQLYDSTLVQAARQRLGTMYDPEDYPPGADLRAKFGITVDITPVPDGQDFRVDVGDAERTRISRQISEAVAQRSAQAEKDAWDRCRSIVSTIQTRLSAPKPIIRESLIDNASELVRLLPGLNVSGCPKMQAVCDSIATKLIVSPDVLRNSMSARQRVAKAAEEILEMMP